MRMTHIGSDVGVILICPAPVNPENPTFLAVCDRNGAQIKTSRNQPGNSTKSLAVLSLEPQACEKSTPDAMPRFVSVEQRTRTYE